MLRLTQTDKNSKPILVNEDQIIAVRERKSKSGDSSMVSVVKTVDGKEYEVRESLDEIEAKSGQGGATGTVDPATV